MSRAAPCLILLGCCALISVGGCSLLPPRDPNLIRVSLLGPLNHKDVSEDERLLCIAEGLLDLGHLDEAEKRLRQALSLNPQLGPAYNNLGLVHYERRELYEAAHAFNRAMELMPGEPLPQYNLGLTLEKGGRLNQAIFHYERAHDLASTNPVFLGNLLRARIARGDTTDDLDYLLRDLIVYDTRPDWIEWAEDELQIMLPKARRATERVVEPPEPHEAEPAASETPSEPLSEEPLLEVPRLSSETTNGVPGP